MLPTVEHVYQNVRVKLGDDQAVGGDVFTNDYLEQHFGTAYRKMFRVLSRYGSTENQRTAHFLLPKNTRRLYPSTAGITNFGEPLEIRRRQVDTSFAITVIAPDVAAAQCTLTTAAHAYEDGNTVIVFGVVDGVDDTVNNEWTIDAPSTTTIQLNGCIAAALFTAYTASSATVARIAGGWGPALNVVTGITGGSTTANTNIGGVLWQDGYLEFDPVPEDKLLRIMYEESGDPPLSPAATLPFDDSLDFLAAYTAALAAKSKGAAQEAGVYLMEAVGSDIRFDSQGGHLGDMIANGIQTLQQQRFQPQRFRPRRNSGNHFNNVWS